MAASGCPGVLISSANTLQTALFLRDDGTVLGHDLRVPTKPLFQATVGRSLHSRFDRVRAAPRRSHYLSVSGPCVALFDTSAWSGDVSGGPRFCLLYQMLVHASTRACVCVRVRVCNSA